MRFVGIKYFFGRNFAPHSDKLAEHVLVGDDVICVVKIVAQFVNISYARIEIAADEMIHRHKNQNHDRQYNYNSHGFYQGYYHE